MTSEEKNARRRELDADPFHRSLTRKTAKKWREKNRERINARRREKYAQNVETERQRAKEWRDRNPERCKASWRKWAANNAEKLRARDAARAKSPEEAERRRRAIAERRRRIAEDPEYAAKIRAQRRNYYHRMKHTERGLRWMEKCLWEPKWRKVVAKGPVAVQAYLRRCKPRTRHYFAAWYTRTRNLIDASSPQMPDSELLKKNRDE